MIFEQRYHGRMRTLLPIAVVVVLAIGLACRVFLSDSSPRRGEELVRFVQSIAAPDRLRALTLPILEQHLELNASQRSSVRLVLTKLESDSIDSSNAVWQIVSVLDRSQQDRLADFLR